MPFASIRTIATLAVLALATGATAQTMSPVTFAPGNFGTMVSGSITGQDYTDYLLEAQAGQEMFVDLTVTESTGNGTVYFNVLSPDKDAVALYVGSMDGNTTTIELPETGTYAIRVYHMGNDEDTGKTSSFNIDLSIQ
ncbi:MAG: hypothetical protein ACEPO2_15535 [Pelagibaca sp.]